MPERRFRPTIRWLLAVIVLVAVGLGGFLAGVRWERSRNVLMEGSFVFPEPPGTPAPATGNSGPP